MTKDEIRAEIEKLGGELPPAKANVEDHEKALASAKRAASRSSDSEAAERGVNPQGADAVVDGHNAASRVVDADEDEKPGPASIMSKEIRPDERGDAAVGESAFAQA